MSYYDIHSDKSVKGDNKKTHEKRRNTARGELWNTLTMIITKSVNKSFIADCINESA